MSTDECRSHLFGGTCSCPLQPGPGLTLGGRYQGIVNVNATCFRLHHSLRIKTMPLNRNIPNYIVRLLEKDHNYPSMNGTGQ
jgi:hypothetical protein